MVFNNCLDITPTLNERIVSVNFLFLFNLIYFLNKEFSFDQFIVYLFIYLSALSSLCFWKKWRIGIGRRDIWKWMVKALGPTPHLWREHGLWNWDPLFFPCSNPTHPHQQPTTHNTPSQNNNEKKRKTHSNNWNYFPLIPLITQMLIYVTKNLIN